MGDFLSIADNIRNIDERIIKSCIEASRNRDGVKLLAVTKTVDVDKIIEAIDNGVTDVGENKPQELKRKYEVIGDKVRWHMIGSLQTNKVKYIIDKVDLIHSLDRISLCEEIQKRAEHINRDINCLIQVNISREATKQGLYVEDVIPFIIKCSDDYSRIRIKGLMTIAPATASTSQIEDTFRGLKLLSDEIEALGLDNVEMRELSMGMSNDFDIAIKEGSTIVRIGTSIFGERNYNL